MAREKRQSTHKENRSHFSNDYTPKLLRRVAKRLAKSAGYRQKTSYARAYREAAQIVNALLKR